ncbi:hypothetical protein PFICI_14183 [Pestalotiopsis fici W106-1]|uniref:DUF7704 domain-containing protein n=1 Tax=Pestalotiopsis fici (strain W106-1 / CGMCC3.15140) TaxID=1229662 RepID=W3WME7_PESFW|nr:uncharacterized protein PFICI_14183 [Pestalotiopsis fici W106-1]ETS74317.1 hypothetical protein PFICI_14183 [Pestalotiopsis fici W106-1]
MTCLPTWPFLLFGVIEPLLLVWAYIVGMRDPLAFYADQVPGSPVGAVAASGGSDLLLQPQSLSLVLQLQNVYLLLAAMAILACVTGRDPATARLYLVAVALADLGHIYASYAAMGPDAFWDYRGWNQMVWGNVGVSAFLHINRLLTVLGVFGPVAAVSPEGVKRAKKA